MIIFYVNAWRTKLNLKVFVILITVLIFLIALFSYLGYYTAVLIVFFSFIALVPIIAISSMLFSKQELVKAKNT